MQFHKTADAIVKCQKHNFILGTRQFHRRTAGSMRY